jgi:RNA polymerase sigma-70 factor (ECF subfamily)
MWLTGVFNKEDRKKIDIDEFRQIFSEYYPSLVLYASRFLKDINLAEDTVQEALIVFWQENEKLRNKNLIKPYLFKSVRNRALNLKKKEKKLSSIEELFDQFNAELRVSEQPDAFDTISFGDLQKDLEKAISELPEQRQIIFRMSRFQNLKHKEIAKELMISPKTVETQIYRSLSFLRDKLKLYLD